MPTKKDLLKALEKFREDIIAERDSAASPGPYLTEADYSSYTGQELAYDEVVYKLNKLIEEHK